MDDSLVVGRGQSIGNLLRTLHCFADRQRALVELLAQRAPFEQFRHNVGSFLLSADIVDRENIWMIQRRHCARLLLESTQSIRIACERFRQNFDRHLAPQARIFRSVHLAHSACTQRRLDFVRPKLCSGR